VKATISSTLHNANGTDPHQTLLSACLHKNQRQKSTPSSITWTGEKNRVQRRKTEQQTQRLQKVGRAETGPARRSRRQRPVSQGEPQLPSASGFTIYSQERETELPDRQRHQILIEPVIENIAVCPWKPAGTFTG